MKLLKIFFTSLVILGAVVLAIVGFQHFENYEKIYYSQIDNENMKVLDTTDDLKYEYTLDCYDKSGKEKELTFKTVRELKQDAYVLLEVRSLGVHKWEEVQFSELPEKVQEKYK